MYPKEGLDVLPAEDVDYVKDKVIFKPIDEHGDNVGYVTGKEKKVLG